MRICYIYRDKNRKRWSIENVFSAVEYELTQLDNVELVTFHYDNANSIFKNICKLRTIKADIYHITGDINWITIFLFNKKVVNTIHDLGTFHHLTGTKKLIYKLLWIKLPLLFSVRITVVSSFVKVELSKLIKSDKVSVIANPVNQIFKFDYPKKQINNKKRLLIVGTGANKNIELIFQASIGINVILLIIGSLNQSQKDYLISNDIEFQNNENLTFAEINDKYIEADFVVFASIHEGFGMPVIEANAVGRPLIVSDLVPMSDIAGEAAILFDPFNVRDLREKILLVLNNHDIQVELIDKGLKNASKYTAFKIANDYYVLYCGII